VTDAQLLERVDLLKRLAILALGGLAALVVGPARPDGRSQAAVLIIGALAVCPAAVYLVLVTLWHWKGRYRGTHSDLWGAVLLLEISGWLKLVYFFRHVLPDARGTGRYTRRPLER
jgi:hypothetical protein